VDYPIVSKATEFSKDFEIKAHQDNMDQMMLRTIDFLYEEIKETQTALNDNDRPEIIDGFGDVAFIALNGIYKEFCRQGDNHLDASTKVIEVMKRICEANLGKKHPDGHIKYVNGKVQKPEGWKPPQYEDLIK
jgi:hypothetical protein